MHNQSLHRYSLVALISGFVALAAPAFGQVINEYSIIQANDRVLGDFFGSSVAMSNGILAIGAKFDIENGIQSGSAYLVDTATDTQLFKLIPSDGVHLQYFGHAIDIHNGLVAVGAFFDDVNGSRIGSAYIFDALTGAQVSKIIAPDAAADDYFGQAIAIHNGIVAVGSPRDDDMGSMSGSAYLFNATTGAQIAKLLPSDGVAADQFGFSIAMNGNTVAVGAWLHSDNGSASGAVYLFDATTGLQTAKLLANDGASNDLFGRSLAMDNTYIVVGAEGDDDGLVPILPISGSGSVYVFDKATGTQLTKLHANDPSAFDQFGFSVDVNSGVVAVGANLKEHPTAINGGGGYLFDAATGAQITQFYPVSLGNSDFFGSNIAIENGIVAAGVERFVVNGGATFMFTVPPPPCLPDLNGDGILDNGDINAFITLFFAADLAADMNNDSILDNGDINTFIALFLAGC